MGAPKSQQAISSLGRFKGFTNYKAVSNTVMKDASVAEQFTVDLPFWARTEERKCGYSPGVIYIRGDLGVLK